MTDEAALERFEALLRAQPPAAQPWQPVTDYSFEARQAIEGRHPELIREVLTPRRVLDYGAGYGHLVRLLRAIGIKAWAYEPHLTLAKEAQRWKRRIDICGDQRERYDLVICREVLEHLPLIALRQHIAELCDLTSRYVYVTTRFHPAPDHFLDVATQDDLDPTHITMLNQSFLRLLFVLQGFRRRADLEARMDWQHKGRCLVYERT